VRTFAPFVAGVGAMTYPRFLMFNVIGGATWVTLILGSGYFFGNIPVIRNNFSVVVVAIIFISILPAIVEYVKHRRAAPAVQP
jgi:membrane-associated protein